MHERLCDIGLMGLDPTGRNLALNLADHGYSVAAYDMDPNKLRILHELSEERDIRGADEIDELVGLLRAPRAVLLLLPPGPAVDAAVTRLQPYLHPKDVVLDGADSHFKDTDARAEVLAREGVHFLGLGISGGLAGARHGPCLMAGGPPQGYERVRAVLEAIAARVTTEPCASLVGRGSAGHFVKAVHNGVQYAAMQLIAETYDLMRRGMGLPYNRLQKVYEEWNQSELASYLLGITADIFGRLDDRTGRRLADVILDVVTPGEAGGWFAQDAIELGVPVPTIDAAVAMRSLSRLKDQRMTASKVLCRSAIPLLTRPETLIEQLRNALYVGTLVSYAQGMAMLWSASRAYSYDLDLEEVARIWRGAVIDSALLDEIQEAYCAQPELPNPLLDTEVAHQVMARQEDLRSVVWTAAELGIPAPAMMASLAYLDGYRSAWIPANMIQAQRDYTEACGYQRVDARGLSHTEWRHCPEKAAVPGA